MGVKSIRPKRNIIIIGGDTQLLASLKLIEDSLFLTDYATDRNLILNGWGIAICGLYFPAFFIFFSCSQRMQINFCCSSSKLFL